MATDMSAVDRLLESLSKEKLCRFIRQECFADEHIRERFLALGISRTSSPADVYADRIENLIDDYQGRYGYVEYRDTHDLNRDIWEILYEAEDAINGRFWDVAVNVLTGVSDSLERIINCGDDSGGYLGEIINGCFDMWHNLCRQKLPRSVSDNVFKIAVTRFENEDLKGWDWWWSWIEIAISLADTPARQKSVMKALDAITPDEDDIMPYMDVNKALNYRLMLMSKTATPEEQRKFMYDHAENPDFREKLMQMAWDEENYDEVLRLAGEGLAIAAKEEFSPINEVSMCEWEMKVYRLRNDRDNMLRLARYFFFNSDKEDSTEAMYGLMKSLVAPSEWSRYVDSLLREAEECRDTCTITYIYTQEKLWDRYMEFLRKAPLLYQLDNAPEELKKLYKDDFISLYSRITTDYFITANDRVSYRQGVDLLRKIISLGGQKEADRIIAEQKARKPRRPALIEELSKI